MSTIAAVSTPLAASGLGVVRISGEEAFRVGEAMFRPLERERKLSGMRGYTCAFGRIFDAEDDIDEAVATVFRAPKSYTGEDTVEFSCHGSPAVLKRVLRTALANGAVLAGPGEFTKRAFLNGKFSLDEAEAVADMIAARSAEAGKAALAMMEGSLYREISGVREELLALQAHFAAWADYPEEDVPELSPEHIAAVLSHTDAVLKKLIAGYDTGRMVREGAAVVIAGKPNVGKSTIMNLLSGHNRSIVTEVAGTTRDVVEESVLIGCIPVRLLDTAGLRETADPVERIGVDLANTEISRCDLLIAVFDSSRELDADDLRLLEELRARPSVAVINKSDLAQKADAALIAAKAEHCVTVSAEAGTGMELFRSELEKVLGACDFDPSAPSAANERQLDCLKRACAANTDAENALNAGITLDAVDICVETELDCLFELTGEKASDAVIDEVFSQFCVGK